VTKYRDHFFKGAVCGSAIVLTADTSPVWAAAAAKGHADTAPTTAGRPIEMMADQRLWTF